MKTIPRICALIAIFSYGHAFGQNSFQLNLGGVNGAETIANSFVFSGNGVSATAKSWSISRTGTAPTLQRSEIVQWGPGLGSKNSSEVITDTPYVPYYVDNQDHYDLILFVFDKQVDLTSINLNPSGKNFDTDVSYWFGNVSSDINLTGKSLADLSALGFGSIHHDDTAPSTSSRNVGLTSPADGVNALLVGARVGGDSSFDYFKLSTVNGTTVVPEPSAAMLCGLAAMTLLVRRKR
ncbi:MAG: PEP-CTERM sorting domain-containing protein [Luteolibacter sp.]